MLVLCEPADWKIYYETHVSSYGSIFKFDFDKRQQTDFELLRTNHDLAKVSIKFKFPTITSATITSTDIKKS